MNTTLTRLCTGAASLASVSALSLLAVPAFATTAGDCATQNQMASGNGNCTTDVTAESSTTDSVHGHVTSVNGVKFSSSSGARVLAFVQQHGATHHQMQGRKITLKHAGSYNTSYINVYGQEAWKMKWYPAGYTFVHGSDGYDHDPHCWNKVVGLPHGPQHAPKGHIQLHGHWKIVPVFKFSTSSKAVLEQTSVSTATAWANGYLYDYKGNLVVDGNGNPVNTCHAEGHGRGYAHNKAVGVARLRGKIFMSVSEAIRASNSGANISLSAQLKGETHAEFIGNTWASARGSAVTDASAKAICTNTYQPPPTTSKSITITSMTDLNLIAAGKNSGEYDIDVNASDAGGSLTIDPGIGGVSTCDSTTPQGSLKFSNLSAGDSSYCVIIYAPDDADKPAKMTVTSTATLAGATPSVRTDDIDIQYPVRA